MSRGVLTDLAWILGGICLALIAIHQVFWWFFIPAFILLITAFRNTHSWHEIALWSLYVGVAKALGGLAPVWHTYPLTWIDLGSPVVQISFIATFWITTAFAMGCGFVLPGLVIYDIYKRKPLAAVLMLPFLWVVAEVLGSLGASIAFLGPGSTVNINYAHYYTGFAISHLAILYPLIQFGGVYVLSAVTAAIGFVMYRTFTRPTLVWISAAMLLGVLTIGSYVTPSVPAPTLDRSVVAVELTFPSSEYHKAGGPHVKAENIVEATLAALATDPDIVLLPEDARLTDAFGGATTTLAALMAAAPTSTTLIIDTSYTKANDGHSIQRAYYYDLARQQIYETDKQYLVAEGEYVTYLFSGLLRAMGKGTLADELNDEVSYRPGPKQGYAAFPDDVPGLMFCYDSSSIFGARQVTKLNQYPLIVHAASHSWFHSPFIYWEQLDDMLRVQAIWNKVTIVRAGNMVPSQAYLPNGQIITGEKEAGSKFWHLVRYQL